MGSESGAGVTRPPVSFYPLPHLGQLGHSLGVAGESSAGLTPLHDDRCPINPSEIIVRHVCRVSEYSSGPSGRPLHRLHHQVPFVRAAFLLSTVLCPCGAVGHRRKLHSCEVQLPHRHTTTILLDILLSSYLRTKDWNSLAKDTIVHGPSLLVLGTGNPDIALVLSIHT